MKILCVFLFTHSALVHVLNIWKCWNDNNLSFPAVRKDIPAGLSASTNYLFRPPQKECCHWRGSHLWLQECFPQSSYWLHPPCQLPQSSVSPSPSLSPLCGVMNYGDCCSRSLPWLSDKQRRVQRVLALQSQVTVGFKYLRWVPLKESEWLRLFIEDRGTSDPLLLLNTSLWKLKEVEDSGTFTGISVLKVNVSKGGCPHHSTQ